MAPRLSLYGYQRHVLQIRIPAGALGGGAASVLTSWTPGFVGEVEKIEYIPTVVHTCAGSGTRAFSLKKGSSATGITIAVVTPTHATACAAAVGAVLPQTSLAAPDCKFGPTDTLTIDYAAGTVFTAGQADLYVTLRQRKQSLA